MNLLEQETEFPAVFRKKLDTVQVNLTLRCNQACVHCHVDAGPKRSEELDEENIKQLIKFIVKNQIQTVDITGGAPELHPYFRTFVDEIIQSGARVVDRCNLTILFEEGQEDLAEFLSSRSVDIVASMPCYLQENVDKQRGKGVFSKSINALKILNELGYGIKGTGKIINLVYNPQGPVLPPSQEQLEKQYKQILLDEYNVQFNNLLALCNMPINRFAQMLDKQEAYNGYMSLLKTSHDDDNLERVMCKSLVSVDWQGYLYDCDFNQMLGLPLQNGKNKIHISQLIYSGFEGNPIFVKDHCFACTAGQGSSCGGALQSK